MIKHLVLFLAFLVSSLCFAQELINMRIVADESIEIKNGDFLNATLQIYPYPRGRDIGEYEKLRGTKFFDSLYVIETGHPKFNANNTDVLEVPIELAVAKYLPKKDSYTYSFNGMDYQVFLRNIKFVDHKFDSKQNKMVLQNQSYSSEFKLNYLAIFITLSLVILFGAGGLRYFTHKKNKAMMEQSMRDLLEYWDSLFQKANSREELEEIYKRRKEWLEIIGVETQDIAAFFDEINRFQFKEDWSDIDKTCIMSSFDLIKDIFRQKNGI